MKRDNLEHRFVDFIPEQLEEGILYVAIEYTTVAHLCCCGCGQEVSITLSPTDWRLIFDSKTVSLEPSIGSWSLPCQSHYFITSNRIVWARQWSRAEIDAGRRYDAARKQPHRTDDSPAETPVQAAPDSPETDSAATHGIWGLAEKLVDLMRTPLPPPTTTQSLLIVKQANHFWQAASVTSPDARFLPVVIVAATSRLLGFCTTGSRLRQTISSVVDDLLTRTSALVLEPQCKRNTATLSKRTA